jgi:type IV secretory pathway VirB4 component
MMEILDEIESLIIQEKVKTQISDWIKNLRKKADIQKLLQEM